MGAHNPDRRRISLAKILSVGFGPLLETHYDRHVRHRARQSHLRPMPTVMDPSKLVTGRETARQFLPLRGRRRALRSEAVMHTCSYSHYRQKLAHRRARGAGNGIGTETFPPAIATGMNSPVSRAASEQSRARIEQPSTRLPDLRTEVWCAWTKGSPKLASKCGVCRQNVASPRARVGWDCAASDSSIDHCAICASLSSDRGLSQRLATNQASATAPAEKTISPGTLSHTSRSTTGCCMNSAERAYQ